jgi:hypothetical protein
VGDFGSEMELVAFAMNAGAAAEAVKLPLSNVKLKGKAEGLCLTGQGLFPKGMFTDGEEHARVAFEEGPSGRKLRVRIRNPNGLNEADSRAYERTSERLMTRAREALSKAKVEQGVAMLAAYRDSLPSEKRWMLNDGETGAATLAEVCLAVQETVKQLAEIAVALQIGGGTWERVCPDSGANNHYWSLNRVLRHATAKFDASMQTSVKTADDSRFLTAGEITGRSMTVGMKSRDHGSVKKGFGGSVGNMSQSLLSTGKMVREDNWIIIEMQNNAGSLGTFWIDDEGRIFEPGIGLNNLYEAPLDDMNSPSYCKSDGIPATIAELWRRFKLGYPKEAAAAEAELISNIKSPPIAAVVKMAESVAMMAAGHQDAEDCSGGCEDEFDIDLEENEVSACALTAELLQRDEFLMSQASKMCEQAAFGSEETAGLERDYRSKLASLSGSEHPVHSTESAHACHHVGADRTLEAFRAGSGRVLGQDGVVREGAKIRAEDVTLEQVCRFCKQIRMADKGVKKGKPVRTSSCNACESQAWTVDDTAAHAEAEMAAKAWLAAHERDFA